MSGALDTFIRYQQVQFDENADQLCGFGMPEAYAAAMVEMLRSKNKRTYNLASRVGTPQTPTTIRLWREEILVPAA